jgi:hypothetical protein
LEANPGSNASDKHAALAAGGHAREMSTIGGCGTPSTSLRMRPGNSTTYRSALPGGEARNVGEASPVATASKRSFSGGAAA